MIGYDLCRIALKVQHLKHIHLNIFIYGEMEQPLVEHQQLEHQPSALEVIAMNSYKPRKERITKQQSNDFKQWLQQLTPEDQQLSAAKLAKRYFDERHVEVSRMFACNAKHYVLGLRD